MIRVFCGEGGDQQPTAAAVDGPMATATAWGSTQLDAARSKSSCSSEVTGSAGERLRKPCLGFTSSSGHDFAMSRGRIIPQPSQLDVSRGGLVSGG